MAEQFSVKDFIRERETARQELQFKGFKAPFVIEEVTNDESEKLQNQATTVKVSRGQKTRDFNQLKYTETLLVASVVQPDLNSTELQKAYSAPGDPYGTLKRMLTVGELTELSQAVMALYGLDQSQDDEVEDVKNS
ncbi:hypothetical protein RIN67_03115 [Levilactobacillus namurensis]|uniref:phage tail assembly chaperone n=1 Tax=Levilactobacillus namurensis TaxID=380393 RepID=UPI000464CDD3|nr:hypothetical protein [Levilactobacillus namurensis]MDT7019300.1 hypothetical protein [Levilactobacillus namurensis]WNN66099.1 hypothetical protein RIN67_03115 [Levilactobacillus namurensis]